MFFLHRLLSTANSQIRPFRISCRHFETGEVNGLSGAALCSYPLLKAEILVTSSSMKGFREGGEITFKKKFGT